MTGEHAFQKYKKLIPKEAFFLWLDSLRNSYKLIGPVKVGHQTIFSELISSKELFMEYETTMLSPGKLFLYKAIDELFVFRMKNKEMSINEIILHFKKSR